MKDIEWYREHLQELKFVGYSCEEQETSINWTRCDPRAMVSVTDNTTLTEIKHMFADGCDWRLESVWAPRGCADNEVGSMVFSCPKGLISFRRKVGNKTMTDEQKAAAAERMKNMRGKKNGNEN